MTIAGTTVIRSADHRLHDRGMRNPREQSTRLYKTRTVIAFGLPIVQTLGLN